MGLDMYLYQELKNDKGEKVRENIGYWRKANQIHNWFVENIQNGEDDQEMYEVSYEQLIELRDLCKKVLEKKDEEYSEAHLPTRSGFFFGGTDYDEYYYEDLENTIELIDGLDENGKYFYDCWW